MPFCPVPHSSRDQAWLAVGAIAGGLVAQALVRRASRSAPARRNHVYLVIEMAVHDPSRFFAAFNQLSARTLAEPSCVRYEILQDIPVAAEGPLTPLEASSYTVIGEWTSQEALDAHNESAHFREHVPQIRRAADIVLRKLYVAYVPDRSHMSWAFDRSFGTFSNLTSFFW